MTSSDVRHIPAQPARVEVVVSMTPEEYAEIGNRAAWDSVGGVAEYMKACALGHQKRGC